MILIDSLVNSKMIDVLYNHYLQLRYSPKIYHYLKS